MRSQSTVIHEIAPRLKDRQGGYTRVLKLSDRHGDGATNALLQFSVPIEIGTKETKPKKEKEKKPKAAKPAVEEKQTKPEKPAKVEKPSAKPVEKTEKEKPETEKRGGFLSKLRKFLTGDENK